MTSDYCLKNPLWTCDGIESKWDFFINVCYRLFSIFLFIYSMQPTALPFLLFMCYFIWIVKKYGRENGVWQMVKAHLMFCWEKYYRNKDYSGACSEK